MAGPKTGNLYEQILDERACTLPDESSIFATDRTRLLTPSRKANSGRQSVLDPCISRKRVALGRS